MKAFKKIFSKVLWGLFTVFFAIAFVILMIAETVVKENESNINYALGINPYEAVKSKEDEEIDSEYVRSDYYKSDGVTYDDAAMRQGSMSIAERVAADGAVLLWNDGALPLAEGAKLSFFGVSSKPKSWLYTGYGSGNVGVTTTDFPSLKAQFESEGKYTVNPTLWNSYSDSQANKQMFNPNGDDNHYREFSVNEKAWSSVNSAASGSFATYGDAAIYFISRTGSEDGDTWFDTSKHAGGDHTDNNYLDLTKNERDTLKALCDLKGTAFKKVILVLNTGTPMQMKTVSKYAIDCCLWVGMGGNASFAAVYDVMSGKVNPSGRLVDTYAYDSYSAPSTINTGAFEFTKYGSLPAENRSSNSYNHCYMVYQEGIYVGYRYYETRYEDCVTKSGSAASTAGVVNGKGNWSYSAEVKFPFGYGLSYTEFEYTSFAAAKSGDDYKVTVGVKNVGKVAGKTPVQIYIQKPYTDYDKKTGIEKAAVELVGYTKTDILAPDEEKTYTVTVKGSDFKTYDSYGKKTYILEKGNYYLATGFDAHDALNNILALKGYGAKNGMVDSLGNAADGNKKLAKLIDIAANNYAKYAVSATGYAITNQFDNADINVYKGTSSQKITYLSRNNWKDTYPTAAVSLEARNRTMVADMQYYKGVTEDENAEMPKYGKVTYEGGELRLIMLRGLDYDNALWDHLLNQLTWDDTVKLCGVANNEISPTSIGSPHIVAHDGPAGVKASTPAEIGTLMAFPCGVLIASTFDDGLVEEMGEAFGLEMLHAGVGELYGTGAGIHRSTYGGRNWEYFSEDGFLSGKILCAETVGMQSKGAIVNIKHLVLNDQEIYRCGVATFANEQSIREIYLKAFEEAVTVGKANGIMSSLNRIGCTWAGRHKGLLTEVVRNEWGFVGFIETDAATGIYMRDGNARAEAVIAGNDMWLRGTSNETELWGDYKNSPTVCSALRESAHRILYTILNSASMNGVTSNTRFVYIKPWYYGLLTGGQIAAGVLTGITALMLIASFVLPILWNRNAKKVSIEEGQNSSVLVDNADSNNNNNTEV